MLRRYYYTPRIPLSSLLIALFFLKDTTPTDIYTLSLHDALPILLIFLSSLQADNPIGNMDKANKPAAPFTVLLRNSLLDRKSTRLNSSHVAISYAVFCLKKKTKK